MSAWQAGVREMLNEDEIITKGVWGDSEGRRGGEEAAVD